MHSVKRRPSNQPSRSNTYHHGINYYQALCSVMKRIKSDHINLRFKQSMRRYLATKRVKHIRCLRSKDRDELIHRLAIDSILRRPGFNKKSNKKSAVLNLVGKGKKKRKKSFKGYSGCRSSAPLASNSPPPDDKVDEINQIFESNKIQINTDAHSQVHSDNDVFPEGISMMGLKICQQRSNVRLKFLNPKGKIKTIKQFFENETVLTHLHTDNSSTRKKTLVTYRGVRFDYEGCRDNKKRYCIQLNKQTSGTDVYMTLMISNGKPDQFGMTRFSLTINQWILLILKNIYDNNQFISGKHNYGKFEIIY